MTRQILGISAAALIIAATTAAGQAPTPDRARLDRIQQNLTGTVPHVLCLDANFTTGGQPIDDAYAKAAINGFRSVVSQRTSTEGIDLVRKRARVESTKMRFFNIPVSGSTPRPEQADEFLRLTRDKTNHPKLINCASDLRVRAFMMILRVVDLGWSEETALEETVKIGLNNKGLKKFAKEHIAQQKAKRA
ncbi:MAG TPA: hypothetical protein VNT76_06460 [Candidatus Binatus sp.]|nr:hypothetical protein [Candidatus Binatus sp.]